MQHSIPTITIPAAVTRLTTLERVKAELNITTDEFDELLGWKIDEATSDIEAHIGRTLNRATISELFWGDSGDHNLILNRYPVASVTSVTLDDVVVDADEYRLDGRTGQLFRLDAFGYPCVWWWCQSVTVVYEAGYLLPGEDDRNLPPALEAAAVSLLGSYWQSRGRDPLVKAEDTPGLGSIQYWVGSVGEGGQLPPDVMTKIGPFRRSAL